jgi:hypothetical protein
MGSQSMKPTSSVVENNEINLTEEDKPIDEDERNLVDFVIVNSNFGRK